MRNRTVVVVLVLALLLVGFIVLFERDMMTTSEIEERRNNVFKHFKRDLVESLTVRGAGGEEISVERAAADETAEEKWRITSPKVLDADDSEVRSILSAIDYLLIGRTVKGKDTKSDARFGLSNPRVKASFTIRKKKTSFGIGSDATGDKVYVAVDGDEEEIFAVDKEFLGSLDKALDDLRSKKLVAETMADAVEIEVQRREESYKLKREKDSPWRIDMAGSWILAAEDQVGELLRTVGDLKAEKFIADDVKDDDLDRWGLADGLRSVTITVPDGEKTEVRIGTACPSEENQVYVYVAGSGSVVCADDGFVPVLERPKARLEEKRPAVFQDEDVTRIALDRGGKTLTLERKEDAWKLADKEGPALDAGAVAELLKALRETRAVEIEVGEAAVSGLGEPIASVAMSIAEDSSPVKLGLFKSEKEDTDLVRRDGEAAVLAVSKDLLEKVSSDVLAFRERKIANGDKYDVERMQIRGAAGQVLEKKDGSWMLVEPLQTAADGTAARELAGLIAEIEAKRFAAAEAAPMHGFEKPFAVVTASFAKEEEVEQGKDKTGSKEVVLEIGAIEKGAERFARLKGDDKTVFVVSEEYEHAVSSPMIARDLFQINETEIKQLSFAVGAKEQVFKHNGELWSGPDGVEIDSAEIKRILADLGGLKTLRAVSFGTQKAAFGATTLVLKSWTTEQLEKGEPSAMTIGQKSDKAEEDGYFARLEGLDATFALPARVIDELVAFIDHPASQAGQ
jgi:hypothetical protein